MARRSVLVGLLVAFIAAAPAGAQTDGRPDCADYPTTDVILPNGYPFDVRGAVALFRFHRQKDALRELDAARAIARGPWRWRIPPDRREKVASALDALRKCLAATRAPRLARLTVRVLGDAPRAANHVGPQAGARVYVEGIAVGRTGRNGTLTARVPSGPITVEAEVPIHQWNWADTSLAPGQSGSVEITLSEGKEVNERTALVLAEAVDDIVPVTSRSLTLKFMRNGRLAPVTSIDHIDVVDRQGNLRGQLDEHFSVVRGEIVAATPGRVFDALASQFGHTIRLRVQAMASGQELHQGLIAFRVGQSPLFVTLAPPPSHPTLPLSKIEVGISVLGAGIAVQRESDAKGRVEIKSLPHGTIAFECVAISDGKYYYGQAILVHSGPRSVTLILRHVDDLKNGVTPLRFDARDANHALPLPRTISPPPAGEEASREFLLHQRRRTANASETGVPPRVHISIRVGTMRQQHLRHFVLASRTNRTWSCTSARPCPHHPLSQSVGTRFTPSTRTSLSTLSRPRTSNVRAT